MAKSSTAWSDEIKRVRKGYNVDLNRFIKFTLSTLPGQSPKYTGFFASSWQAKTYRIRADQDRIQPWININTRKRKDPGVPARVEPRFYPPSTRFKFGDTIYIGNRASYARQALGSADNQILNYFEVGINDEINRAFKQTKLKVATGQVLSDDAKEAISSGDIEPRNAPASGVRYSST